jgi:iron complex outermembrane receptor protein
MLMLTLTPALATDLTGLSLEELLAVEVTSVGKKAQSLADAAAAVFVIGSEDIRRSGATSIPEALRMAPGIQVKRLDANKWAVSARGFNGRFANKLLVLIDGRTVYTPSFSGVYWENQDVMLADVERIEVIRGPGATLWGANAVNGVINIITKSAADTQGGLAIAGAGTEERAFGALRYGFEPAEGTFARAYVKYHERDALRTILGDDGQDNWDIGQGGFRVDSTLVSGDSLTLHGDVYSARLNQQIGVPDLSFRNFDGLKLQDTPRAEGWNLVGRWERALSVTSSLSVQLYYDHSERSETYVDQRHDILDIELQHSATVGSRHDIVWGIGYRNIDDRFRQSRYITSELDADNRSQWSAFLQDDVTLVPERLRLTLGTKLEHNDYTGLEVQPNLRLLWKPNDKNSLWSAVSRAVRTPSRLERSGKVIALTVPPGRTTPHLANAGIGPAPLPIVISSAGSSGVESETLTAYELGYRLSPTRRAHFDLAVFYNDYRNLRGVRGDASSPRLTSEGYIDITLPWDNSASGQSYGAELAAELQVADWWRMPIAYSYLDLVLDAEDNRNDSSLMAIERADARHKLSLRSLMSPREDLDLDLWLRYVSDSYPDIDVGTYGALKIPAYWELDLRVAWRPQRRVELAIVGQNLLNDAHAEGYQATVGGIPAELERGVYGSLRIDF